MSPRTLNLGDQTIHQTYTHIGQSELFELYEVISTITPTSGWPHYTPNPAKQSTKVSVLKRVIDIDAYCKAKDIDFNKCKVKYKRNTRDRPKRFFAFDGQSVTEYVEAWLQGNNLKGSTT